MRLAAALATAVVAAGCGILQPGVPDWVANRQPLESCGEEMSGFDAEARRCLLAAFEDGRGAEVISTNSTIEGDPITEYIRVHENGVIEIFVDATRDRYGSGEWGRVVCADLVPVEEANDRPDVAFPGERVFVEDGCKELPVP